MSGNPFRKQQPVQENDNGNAGEKKSKSIRDYFSDASDKPAEKVKKVQFVSPVSSPQEPPSHHPRFPSLEELDDARKSPPPTGTEFENIDTKALLRGDPTAGGTIDLQAHDQLQDNSAGNTPISPTPPVPQLNQPPPGRRGPPANPFARTLANMEQEATGKEAGDGAKKPAMDVDAFKRLLLTGKLDTPSASAEPSKQENGSSTDASSVSRQSISNSGKDVTPESPASSLEDASTEEESTESEEAEEEPERVQSTEQPTAAAGPQTVSFDNFEESLTSTDAVAAPAALARERSESDVNKPLPAPPSQPATAPEVSSPSVQSEGLPPQTKRSGVPPPPPSSRRGVKSLNRSRSSSNVQEPSQVGAESQANNAPSKPKPPPPRAPPPRVTSRETKRLSDSQDRGAPSTESVPTLSTTEPVEPASFSSAKLKPPPPPSRGHKPSQQTLKRTPSSSSSIINRKVSPGSGTSGPPPPPPRPRRGENKRSSFDGSTAAANGEGNDTRRSSGMSFDRRDSVSSLQRVAEDETAQAAKAEAESQATQDMLADLDAFQREVDALRAKALAGK